MVLFSRMPWSPEDASKHSKLAGSSNKGSSQWAAIANSELEHDADDAKAIRIASGTVKRNRLKSINPKGLKKAAVK